MDKEKQIEEMAKAVCHLDRTCDECMTSFECKAMMYAKRFYDAGYRKASDVAREIFEEIEKMLNLQAKIVCKTRETAREADEPVLSWIAMLDGRIYSLRVVEEHIAELKKKYTESEKDNG